MHSMGIAVRIPTSRDCRTSRAAQQDNRWCWDSSSRGTTTTTVTSTTTISMSRVAGRHHARTTKFLACQLHPIPRRLEHLPHPTGMGVTIVARRDTGLGSARRSLASNSRGRIGMELPTRHPPIASTCLPR